jgi:hypothetical protein
MKTNDYMTPDFSLIEITVNSSILQGSTSNFIESYQEDAENYWDL